MAGNVTPWALVAALSIGGGVLIALGKISPPSDDGVSLALAGLRAEIAGLGDEVARNRERLEASVREQRRLEASLEFDRSPADMVTRDALPSRPEDASGAAHLTTEAAPSRATATPEEFLTLLRSGVLDDSDPSRSPDAARFWQLARETPLLGDLIEDLEGRLEQNPGDVGTRLQLADAYVAKLLTVPAGPERGVWGTKAEDQWRGVLKYDRDNWEAQFKVAETLAYYPNFLNRTDDALQEMARAREIQEGMAPQPDHAQTYLLQARLRTRKGDGAGARESLETGLRRHPGDEQLESALAALDQE